MFLYLEMRYKKINIINLHFFKISLENYFNNIFLTQENGVRTPHIKMDQNTIFNLRY